jgi:hypothetical protein
MTSNIITKNMNKILIEIPEINMINLILFLIFLFSNLNVNKIKFNKGINNTQATKNIYLESYKAFFIDVNDESPAPTKRKARIAKIDNNKYSIIFNLKTL